MDAAFSPNAGRIVAASKNRTAGLWDAATGKAIAMLDGHTGPVISAAFSPDGRRIITASNDHTARVWDAASGKTIAVLEGHTDGVLSAAFSAEGNRIVTASDDSTARLRDAATGEAVAAFQPPGYQNDALSRLEWRPVKSVAFSPDGGQIITALWDKTAPIWDAASGKVITVLEGHTGMVNGATFSPDASYIVTVPTTRRRGCGTRRAARPSPCLRAHGGRLECRLQPRR